MTTFVRSGDLDNVLICCGDGGRHPGYELKPSYYKLVYLDWVKYIQPIVYISVIFPVFWWWKTKYLLIQYKRVILPRLLIQHRLRKRKITFNVFFQNMRIRNSIGKLFFSSTDRVKKSTLTLFVSPNIWQNWYVWYFKSRLVRISINVFFVIKKTSYVRFGPKLSHKNCNKNCCLFPFSFEF